MNSFGRLFRLSIFGESHGENVGIVIDGVPAGIPLCQDDFNADLDRRKAGKLGTTPRVEADIPKLSSGVFNGFTTGMPIMISFENNNTRSKDYSLFQKMPRPSHADFVSHQKYKGFEDFRGGGHFSARLTTAIVVAGVIAKKITNYNYTTKIIKLHSETNEEKFDEVLKEAISKKDSVGGVVEIRVNNLPVGLGEPYFDSLESTIAHLLFSVGGVKGIEFGLGFAGANCFGSEFNDCIIDTSGRTATNNNGGINGGISNGNELVIKAFVKPTPSISCPQDTYNFANSRVEQLVIEGRHDAAIILRAQVVLEAMVAIALCDQALIYKAYK